MWSVAAIQTAGSRGAHEPPPAPLCDGRAPRLRVQTRSASASERGLTNEPLYVGDPVLAVAAIDEATATEAIERIQVDFEPLPFVVDPIESLRPGGANARTQGNVWVRPAPA